VPELVTLTRVGDINQFAWVSRNKQLLSGPVLEIGSRHYTPAVSQDYRSLCDGMGYLGVDLSAGDNVDLVLDLTRDFEEVDAALGHRTFGTVICASVLEHVDNVWAMASNIARLVEPGGRLFLSVPMSWRLHGYPSDYWRFTPNGVHVLFPSFEFDPDLATISSNLPGEEQRLEDPNDFMVRAASLFRNLLGKRSDYKYVLVPTMLNMVGTKTGSAGPGSETSSEAAP
jgi:SAM-dependent methyltransferase